MKTLVTGHDAILKGLVASGGISVGSGPVGNEMGQRGTSSFEEHGKDASDPQLGRADTSLKRRLDFTVEDSTVEDLSKVMQQGPGSPFTFHSHVTPIVHANELPQASRLGTNLLRHGVAGMELAVAAYIFGRDLPDGEVLVTGVHGIGDMRMLKSLCPVKELYDDIINLTALMCTKINKEETIKKIWLPTTFQDIAAHPFTYDPNALAEIKAHFIGRADAIFKCIAMTTSLYSWIQPKWKKKQWDATLK
ncbi:hypothetical protein PIB30_043970 [Stylosanthes scabra]|uniref:Uncharacterized protein n=1 Tax=Stylosanthes scabra TaxID=79078 RepID=A0ABU6RFR4_9FABA|nr:hypothetical protein [Stylosanthes scabra]